MTGCDGAGMAKRSHPVPEARGSARVQSGDQRSHPTSKARGGSQEEQPDLQGVVAARHRRA